MNELSPCPEHSYGKVEKGHQNALIRVDEGRFAGTIYSYANVTVEDTNDGTDEGLLRYETLFTTFVMDGQSYTKAVDDEIQIEFHEECSRPILHYMIKQAVSKAEAENATQEV